MTNHYPVVILPSSLEAISNATPTLPPIPIEPIKPILNEPKLPTAPIEPTSFTQAWGCGLLTIGFFILIIYSISQSDFMEQFLTQLPFPFNLAFFAAPFIAIYGIYSYHKNSETEKNEYFQKLKFYENNLRQYENDKLNYKSQFEKDLKNYHNITYPSYLRSKQEYEQEKKTILSNENVLKYRKSLVIDFFNNTKRPSKIENLFLTGVSEESFFKFLKTKSSNFHKGYSIVEDSTTKRYYVPDIIYYDNQNGLLIDIEIDEPYLGSDGSPIHYIGYDDKRNDFFIDNGWIVIRFAEEQIVKYPEQCFIFIKHLIREILVGEFNINYDSLEIIPQWTNEEAHKMAFKRTRNNYLKRNLSENLSKEILIEKSLGIQQNIQDDLENLPDDYQYIMLANKPILSSDQIRVIEDGLSGEEFEDFKSKYGFDEDEWTEKMSEFIYNQIKEPQIVRYGEDNKEGKPAGEPVLYNGLIQYKVSCLSKTVRPDIDLREKENFDDLPF